MPSDWLTFLLASKPPSTDNDPHPYNEERVKQTMTCPKCVSREILCIPSSGGDGDNVIAYGWTVLSYIPVTRYICARCGFSEDLDRLG